MRRPRYEEEREDAIDNGRRALVQVAWLLLLALVVGCGPRPSPRSPTVTGELGPWRSAGEDADGPVFEARGAFLKLEVCTPDIIRVLVARERGFFARKSLAAEPKLCDPQAQWSLTPGASTAILATSTLKVEVELASGALSFVDEQTGVMLQERGRTLEPVRVQGEDTFSVGQRWEPNPDESFYGLGQHQQGLTDIRDYPLSLVQYNTEIVVPLVVSSRGYGILWDNTSWTRWGDLTEFTPLSQDQRHYEEAFTAARAGDYTFRTYASGAIRLDVDGKTVIDHFRQGWLPGTDIARVPLNAGQSVELKMSHEMDMRVPFSELAVKPPAVDPSTSLWSHVGDGIDYYFIRGPGLDQVVAGYRRLTGQAPLPPKWALGLWQCRERYESAEQVLDVLAEFRRRRIPIDNVVQDWQYWKPGQWGSHDFDEARFVDPKGWVDKIHEQYHAQLMLSIWPKFHEGTDNFEQLAKAGHLYPRNQQDGIEDFRGQRMSYYDAFSPAARAMYWSQIKNKLFGLGIDAWWMDASEPEVVEGPYPSPAKRRELYQQYMHPTAQGSGSRMLNAYSLVNSQGVYEGLRQAAPDRRVFILTRSAFAGQQRYASASWSGDVTSTWTALKKQIPAGLGFSLSGIPYWTTDIGGFAVPERFQGGDTEEWYELNTRWFQFGTFTPLLRVHGQHPVREMWTMGGDDHVAYQTHVKFTRLRYRLMPYLYSLAGAVTHQGSTLLRPLVMDFPDDPGVRSLADQYLFGPAFLVNPVTDYQARSRRVVLPETAGGWYDFWTGGNVAGGQEIEASAPLESLPLFVRAGSLVPVGPELQFAAEKPADPITLYVYTGRDAEFSLYEDDGLSYAYEKGAHATIPLRWQEREQELTIGARRGSFEGQLGRRSFRVIFVSPETPIGFAFEQTPHATLAYEGQAVTLGLDAARRSR